MELWEQQPKETDRAYAAFLVYMNLEPFERSIDKAWQNHSKNVANKKGRSSTWMEWSAKYNWVERVNAYDKYLYDLEQAATQKALAEKAAEIAQVWGERQNEIREREYAVAVRLLERAEKMLDFPLTRTEAALEDGSPVVIMPYKWSGSTIPRYLEAFSKLGRLSTGLHTDKQVLDVTPDDLSTMSDLELDALAQEVKERLQGKKK